MNIAVVDYTDKDAPLAFTDSLRKTGFGVISHHPIDSTLLDEVYEEWRQFFKDERRFNYLFDRNTQEGYVPPDLSETAKGYKEKDLKEFYHLYPWGRYPEMLSDKTRRLQTQLTELAAQLLNWIELHTPADISTKFSMPLSQMITDSPNTLFRVLRYPPLRGDEPVDAIRAAAHADINLITLLPAATEPGLQVKDALGRWHDIQCDHGMVIVNVGDMLEECSEGWYRSTVHQVKNPTGEAAKQERLSMPLFLHPRDDVRLSERHTAHSYLTERLKELGLL
ncbi:MAG: isopenicillin N synthase family oxygenase [Gammaproteobacteria bacterium]|nr:isopenicillin N synthase family oxygenase [Gammaproteobacteria bacterium]